MSRVYNVLTGAARPAAPQTVAVPVTVPDDGVWENSEDAPYIEIGGPSGPIFFSPPSATVSASIPPAPTVATPQPILEIKPEIKPDATTEPVYPRLAPVTANPAYLSVRFHEIGRGTRQRGDGPDPSLVAFHSPEHPVSGEYRVLRDAIRKQLPEPTPRVLLFSSAAAEAGTTTVLVNLAITLAHDEKTRVLIADANFRRSAVAAKLALKPAPGLCEALAGQIPLTWTLQPSPLPTLQVLATGEPTDTTPALSREFPKLLGQLRQWFDWILVDGGVWSELPHRETVCPAADAIYLVTREADAARAEFTSLHGWVKELGGLLRGYVATRV